MKRAVFILTAKLASVGFLLVLAGCGAQGPPLAKLPVRTVLRHARPLVWLDERFLLAGVDNKIVKLDTSGSKIVEVVAEPYYPRVGNECFSREGGRFAVTAPQKNGQSVSYVNMVSRWIQDWDQPEQFEDFKADRVWDINPHDCTAVTYEKTSGEEQSAPQLLKAAEGRTTVYSRRTQAEGQYEWAVTIDKDGRTVDVTLGEPPFFFGQEMRSSFDQSSGRYFWYLWTTNFDLDRQHWPLKGWWVTPEGTVSGMVILPNGPWIKSFSTLYMLRFFSCGPSCYSHMEMWAGNRQIYVAVWGEAIDASQRGVYRLHAEGKTWEKILAGALDNGLVLSPSGCQIGYATGGRLQIMTVCDDGNG